MLCARVHIAATIALVQLCEPNNNNNVASVVTHVRKP